MSFVAPAAVKTCSGCGSEKPLSEFGRHARRRDGIRDVCKECCRVKQSDLTCESCGLIWQSANRGQKPHLCPGCEVRLSWCSRCSRPKPLGEFSPHPQARTGRHSRCRACVAEVARTDYREVRRKNALKRQYGLTPAEYDGLLASQGGRCALCDRASTLVIDHDHESGRVRGLLCYGCNTGLGKFRDSVPMLMRAADYLLAGIDMLDGEREVR